MTQAVAEGLAQAAEVLGRARRIAVTSHVNPDADALGSALGLALGLRAVGKEVVVALADPVPDYARFLRGTDTVLPALPREPFDAFVFADAAGIERVGCIYQDDPARFGSAPLINLDHHATNPCFGTVNVVDSGASSTSELAFRLLRALNVPVDADTATVLLFGVVGDTGSFRNGATTPGSLRVAADLAEAGADIQRIAFQLFECKTFAAARLWGQVVGAAELDRQRHIVFACLSQAMLEAEGGTMDELEGVAEYLRGVQEARVVMLLKETPEGQVRVSMRSRPEVDVSQIAAALDGGGHRQAAGCTLPGPFERARSILIETYDRLNPR